MQPLLTPCDRTVSLLHALILGADGACIEISQTTIISLVVFFVIAVIVLRWLVKRMLFGPRDEAEGERLSLRQAANLRRAAHFDAKRKRLEQEDDKKGA